MSNPTVLFVHNGHTVSLTEQYHFEVSGPAFDGNSGDRLFSSALDARTRIDERVRTFERQKRAHEKLAIQAIDDTGAPCTIRGIHANTSKLLGAPEFNRGVRDIFPPVPWLIAEVKRWRELQAKTAAIRDHLEQFIVKGSRGYGRIGEHDYDRLLADLQSEFSQKSAAALSAPEASATEDAA